MSDIIDTEALSDEEFMNLTPEQVASIQTQEDENAEEGTGIVEEIIEEVPETVQESDDPVVDTTDVPNSEDGNASTEEPETTEETVAEEEPVNSDPLKGQETTEDLSEGDPEGEVETPEPEAKADPAPKTNDEGNGGNSEEPTKVADSSVALEFYNEITKPFKADGRDMQVRTPAEAVRLMQQGVNYSRRMQELKPLRANDEMMKAEGLDTPEKLNFLIDVFKGKPDAIKQLLKDHKIDPIDLDVTDGAAPFVATDYTPDPKNIEFKDAIRATSEAEGGNDLIADINASWDDLSKEALRDQPVIFENLLEQKRTGVYSKIKAELEHQRSLNFLVNVPFLQAYNQVGDAMEKQGVFKEPEEVQSTETVKPVPIDTGTRKAATQKKTVQPNPNLSSTPTPRSAATPSGKKPEPDFNSMSDEDFLALAPPS